MHPTHRRVRHAPATRAGHGIVGQVAGFKRRTRRAGHHTGESTLTRIRRRLNRVADAFAEAERCHSSGGWLVQMHPRRQFWCGSWLAGCLCPKGYRNFYFLRLLGAGRFEKIGVPGSPLFCPFRWGGRDCLWPPHDCRTAHQLGCISPCLSISRSLLPPRKFPCFWNPASGRRCMKPEPDYCMVLGLLFIAVGAGGLSVDAILGQRNPTAVPPKN